MLFNKLNCIVRYDEPLKNHTTFKIGGNCIALVEPREISDIIEAVKICRKNSIKFFVIGNFLSTFPCIIDFGTLKVLFSKKVQETIPNATTNTRIMINANFFRKLFFFFPIFLEELGFFRAINPILFSILSIIKTLYFIKIS